MASTVLPNALPPSLRKPLGQKLFDAFVLTVVCGCFGVAGATVAWSLTFALWHSEAAAAAVGAAGFAASFAYALRRARDRAGGSSAELHAAAAGVGRDYLLATSVRLPAVQRWARLALATLLISPLALALSNSLGPTLDLAPLTQLLAWTAATWLAAAALASRFPVKVRARLEWDLLAVRKLSNGRLHDFWYAREAVAGATARLEVLDGGEGGSYERHWLDVHLRSGEVVEASCSSAREARDLGGALARWLDHRDSRPKGRALAPEFPLA